MTWIIISKGNKEKNYLAEATTKNTLCSAKHMSQMKGSNDFSYYKSPLDVYTMTVDN